MGLRAVSRVEIVRSKDKRDRLCDFVLRALRSESGSAVGMDCLVLARTPESPVIAALASLSERLSTLRVATRALFPPRLMISPAAERLDSPLIAFPWRTSRDQRLIEAHEQLVLGRDRVWIGDTMRRDPARRDSYECFAEGSPILAGLARTTFLRFWHAAAPRTAPFADAQGTIAKTAPPGLADVLAPANDAAAEPPTRH